jgi:hypothetical protein
MTRSAIIALALMAISIGNPARASDCSDARENYRNAVSEVDYALNRYKRCLSYSDGSDDCSTEFRRLKNAQDELESAVSEIGSNC